MKEIKSQELEIKKALEMAEERIESAEVLFKIGNFRDAISRAYYAFFDAASAALLSKNIVAKTHHGLVILFDKNFIKTKIFPVKIGRWLAKAKQAREEADYERAKEVKPETVEEAIKTAKIFVKEIKRLIEIKK